MKNNKRTPTKTRYTKPLFIVFCEGETEEAYVEFLKTEFKHRCRLKSKMSGSDISTKYIFDFKIHNKTNDSDQVFAMYDADNEVISTKLKKIKDVTILFSNPSIELWFLLHFQVCKKHISAKECYTLIEKHTGGQYKKGVLDKSMQRVLKNDYNLAIMRSKENVFPYNPSSNIPLLFDIAFSK